MAGGGSQGAHCILAGTVGRGKEHADTRDDGHTRLRILFFESFASLDRPRSNPRRQGLWCCRGRLVHHLSYHILPDVFKTIA